MDRAATGKSLCFFYLTYDSRTANRTDSLHQIVNGLVGNIDWGESLTVAACEFPGPNRIGARRRDTSAWLAVEICFPKTTLPADLLNLVTWPKYSQVLVIPVKQESLFSSCVVLFSDSCSCSCAYGWNQYKSAQPITSMESKISFEPHTAFA